MDGRHICVVYRLQSDPLPATYAYVLFEKTVTASSFGYEGWINRGGEIYYVSDTLSSADYSSVQKGDALKEFWDIDPASAIECGKIPKPYTGQGFVSHGMTFHRLLTDGLLIVSANIVPADDSVITDSSTFGGTIIDVKFYPFGSSEADQYWVLNYRGLL